MARMFGTDGVRGIAGTELSIELAMKLGQAGAYVLTKEKSHQPTIIVGCDTRISGDMLANALVKNGIDAQNLHTLENIAKHIHEIILPNDIVLTIGAGTITKLSDLL